MFSLVTRRSHSEGIFKKINVFFNLQWKMPIFEKISVIIFSMSKYEQKIGADLPTPFLNQVNERTWDSRFQSMTMHQDQKIAG